MLLLYMQAGSYVMQEKNRSNLIRQESERVSLAVSDQSRLEIRERMKKNSPSSKILYKIRKSGAKIVGGWEEGVTEVGPKS